MPSQTTKLVLNIKCGQMKITSNLLNAMNSFVNRAHNLLTFKTEFKVKELEYETVLLNEMASGLEKHKNLSKFGLVWRPTPLTSKNDGAFCLMKRLKDFKSLKEVRLCIDIFGSGGVDKKFLKTVCKSLRAKPLRKLFLYSPWAGEVLWDTNYLDKHFDLIIYLVKSILMTLERLHIDTVSSYQVAPLLAKLSNIKKQSKKLILENQVLDVIIMTF